MKESDYMIFELFSKIYKKTSSVPSYTYNPAKEKPIIRASICTGEQVAGFKDLVTGQFHEIMLIRGEKDLEDFKKVYGVEEVEKEY